MNYWYQGITKNKKFERRLNKKESIAEIYYLNRLTYNIDGSLTVEGVKAINLRKNYFELMGKHRRKYTPLTSVPYLLSRETDTPTAIKAPKSNQVNSNLVWKYIGKLYTLDHQTRFEYFILLQ